jgi:hypothetical protein
VGGVIGPILTARIEAGERWRRTLAFALVGLPLAGLGIVPKLPLALGLAFLGGGGMIVGEVLSETALPRLLDDACCSSRRSCCCIVRTWQLVRMT